MKTFFQTNLSLWELDFKIWFLKTNIFLQYVFDEIFEYELKLLNYNAN